MPKQIDEAEKVEELQLEKNTETEDRNKIMLDEKNNSQYLDHVAKENGGGSLTEIHKADDSTTTSTSYFKYHFEVSLSAFDFDWKRLRLSTSQSSQHLLVCLGCLWKTLMSC